MVLVKTMVSAGGLRFLVGCSQSLQSASPDRAAVLKLGKGNCTNTPFSSMAEMELLSQQKVPAHFVALNGNRLNVKLRTGPEVRAQ